MELIDLREIKTVFICPDHNEKYKERCAYMFTLLQKLGFKNVAHYKSGLQTYDPYPLNIATYNILQMHLNEHVFIVEDDIEFFSDLNMIFEIPVNADAIYLGISGCNYNVEKQTNEIGVNFEIINSKFARVLNMLSTHAILYLSQTYKSFIANSLKLTNTANDIEICKHQSKFNVYAMRKPICWQSAALNNNWEWIEHITKVQINDIGQVIPVCF
jgi:hypothetical protein